MKDQDKKLRKAANTGVKTGYYWVAVRQSHIIGLSATILHLLAPWPVGPATSAVLMYVLAIYSPLLQTVIAGSVFLALNLLFYNIPLSPTRIVFCVSLLAIACNTKRQIIPFGLLGFVWAGIWLFSFSEEKRLLLLGFSTPNQAINVGLFEILTLAAIVLIDKIVPRLCSWRKAPYISSQFSLLAHFLAIPWLSSLILVAWSVNQSPLLLARENQLAALEDGNSFVLVFSLLLFTILILAKAISDHCKRLLLRMASLAVSQEQRVEETIQTLETKDLLPYFESLKSYLKKFEELEEQSRIIKRKHRNLAQKRGLWVKALVAKIRGVNKLFAKLPFGLLSFSVDGTILGCSKIASRFLDLPRGDVIGQHLHYLKGTHIWSEEVALFVEETLSASTTKYFERPRHSSTSTLNGSYLELLAVCARIPGDSSEREEEDPRRIHLALLIRKRSDCRTLIRNALTPSRISLLGNHAISTCRRLKTQLEDIFAELATILPSTEDDEQQISPAMLLLASKAMRIGLEEQRRQLEDELSLIDLALSPNSSGVNYRTVNITNAIMNAMELLFTSKRDWDKIVVQNMAPGSDVSKIAVSSSSSLRSVIDDVLLSIDENQLNHFLALVCSLLDVVDAQAGEVTITLCYEKVTVETSRILANINPGTYVRMTLHLNNKRYGSILSKQHYTSVRLLATRPLMTEAVLDMLAMQVRAIGGFVSVQASPNKPVLLTTYLPHEASDGNLADKELRTADVATVMTENDSNEKTLNILIVGFNDSRIQQFSESLAAFNCRVTLCNLEDLLKEFKGVDVQIGIGFDDDSRVNELNNIRDKLSLPDTTSYDAVFLDIPEKNIEAQLFFISISPWPTSVTKFILCHPKEELEGLKDYSRVNFPLPAHQLHTLLENIRRTIKSIKPSPTFS